MKRVNDIASKPPVKLLVVAFTWLMTLDATKPPKFPTELISAFPPAAAVPLLAERKDGHGFKIDVGWDQRRFAAPAHPVCG